MKQGEVIKYNPHFKLKATILTWVCPCDHKNFMIVTKHKNLVVDKCVECNDKYEIKLNRS